MRQAKKAVGYIALGVGFMAVSFAPADAEIASFYGEELRGSPTASGTPFDPDGLTAAHRTLPLGTRLLVKHGDRGVVVTVDDRGPALWTGKDLDLSRAAAERIGLDGVGPVTVERVDSPTTGAPEAPELPKEIVELPRTGAPSS